MSISFNAQWAPDGVPTNVTTAVITIVDNTISTPVVIGADMTNTATGSYSYTYSSEVQGHTYTGTMTLTDSNGAQGIFQLVIFVRPSGTIPTTTDDGSSNYIAEVWAAQRGLWTYIKNSALGALAAMLVNSSGNPNVTYNVSGPTGSESVSFTEFQNVMNTIAAGATEQEIKLTEAIQSVTPFDVRQRLGIRSRS